MKTNFGKGLQSFSLGQYDHALQFFTKAYSENIPPDKHLNLYNMGLTLVFLNKLKEAMDYLSEALQILPDHSNTLHWIAYIFFFEGKLEESEEFYLKAVRCQDRSMTSINGLVHFLINRRYSYSQIENYFYENNVNLRSSEKRLLEIAQPIRVQINYKSSFYLIGVDPKSTMWKSINIYDCYEPYLVNKIIENVSSGDRVIDVGSHIGYYSGLFTQIIKCQKVVSIEPDFYSYSLLKKNCNNKNIPVNKLIGNKTDGNVITLDDLVKSLSFKPSVIKMDVEGFEFEALSGCIETLEALRPSIFLEVHPKFIARRHPDRLRDFYLNLFSFYQIDFIRNHWGSIKGETPSGSIWEKATIEKLMEVSLNIIEKDELPNAFALHCY